MAFSDKDKGLKALLERIKGSKGLALTIGVHGPEGAAQEEGSNLTVADVATIHEFGLGKNPERSFIRKWADEKAEDHQKALKGVAEAIAQGKYDAPTGLERLGNLFVAEVQERIAGNIPPPLKPGTIKRKGSSVALINHGHLRSAIRYKVRKGEGDGSA